MLDIDKTFFHMPKIEYIYSFLDDLISILMKESSDLIAFYKSTSSLLLLENTVSNGNALITYLKHLVVS